MTRNEQLDQVVRRAQAGSQEAFGLLVRRFYRPVCGVAYGLAGDWDAAEDLAQETFLVAWRHREALRNPEKFPAWLMQIARNLAKNWLRSAMYRREVTDRYRESLESRLQQSYQAEDAAMEGRQDALARALGNLSPTLREAVLLFYMEQKSLEETALALGISLSAAKKRTQRGREALRARMEAAWEQDLEQRTGNLKPEEQASRVVGMLALPPVSAGAGQLAATQAASAVSGFGGIGNATGLTVAALAAATVVAAALWALQQTGSVALPDTPSLSTESRAGAAEASHGVAAEGSRARSATLSPVATVAGASTRSSELAPQDAVSTTVEQASAPALKPEAQPLRLDGIVVDEAGQPVSKARIVLYAENFMSRIARPGDDEPQRASLRLAHGGKGGAFAFEGVPPGQYELSAGAPGYQDLQPRALSINSGSPPEPLRIVLSRLDGPELIGRIVDGHGHAVTDALVECRGLIRHDGGLRTGRLAPSATDEDGVFTVDTGGAGLASLAVRSATRGITVFHGVPTDSGEVVTLTWLEDSATLTGVIEGDAGRGGQVVLLGTLLIERLDEDGSVSGWGTSQGARFSGAIGPDGRYEISGIPAELDYRVQVLDAEGRIVMPGLGLDPFEVDEVRVFNHNLETATVIAGVVRGTVSEQPLRDIRVIWEAADNPAVWDEQYIGESRRFEFIVHVPAGKYVIYPAFRSRPGEASMASYGQLVEVVPGHNLELNLTFLDPVTRTIRALDAEGAPVAGAAVRYRFHTPGDETSSWNWGLLTDENGYATYHGVVPYEDASFSVQQDGYAGGETAVFAGQPGDVFEPEVVVLEPRAE